MVKLGIMVSGAHDLSWERWHTIAGLVEELGYESLWRSDHLYVSRGDPRMEALEAWISFSTLAMRTSKIRFGPMVTPITFRHPSVLAKMAASIDQLSGGRLELGLGVGSVAIEHEVFGVPCPPLPVRYEMLEEGIQVILALWTEDSATFNGKHFSLQGAVCYPKPTQNPHPPILVGGNGERRTLPLAAAYADEWNGDSLTPDRYRIKRELLRAQCERIARDPATLRCSWTGQILIGRTDAEILARHRRIQRIVGAPSEPASMSSIDSLAGQGWLVGTPSQVVDQIGHLAEAGVERIVLELYDNADLEVVELIASEVLPAVQPL